MEAASVSSEEISEAGQYDLEGMFIRLDAGIQEVGAGRIVLDTVETLFGVFTGAHVVRAELRRLLRWLKDRGITAVVTGERGELRPETVSRKVLYGSAKHTNRKGGIL